MGWIWFYAVSLAGFLCAVIYTALTQHSTDWLKLLLGVVSMFTALAQALSKRNLRIYLFGQKLWIWFHASRTSLWRFSVRLDGDLGANPIEHLASALKTHFPNWHVEIHSKSAVSLRFKLERTIHLHASFDCSAFSADGQGHLLIRSEELEVTYRSAESKIDQQIVPLISALARLWPHAEPSSTLDVSFQGNNPFFAFYVAHLSADQVSRFNLVFRPQSFSRVVKDKVTVTQDSIAIDASDPESFSLLSKAFLLMSGQVEQFAK